MKQVHCERMGAPHYCMQTGENRNPECDKPDCPGKAARETIAKMFGPPRTSTEEPRT